MSFEDDKRDLQTRYLQIEEILNQIIVRSERQEQIMNQLISYRPTTEFDRLDVEAKIAALGM
jgi:hypothetical protein